MAGYSRAIRVSITASFLLGLVPFLLAQSGTSSAQRSAGEWVKLAEARAQSGQYEKALEYYEKALAAADEEKQKKEIGEDLIETKKAFYLQLVESARTQQPSAQSEVIRYLIQARQLDIEAEALKGSSFVGKFFRGKKSKELEEAAKWAQSMRPIVFQRLATEAGAAFDDDRFPEGLKILEQAQALDPQLFESQNLLETQTTVEARIQQGQSFAEEGLRLLQQKRHSEAKDRFSTAESLFPGQPQVEEGLRQIKEDERAYADFVRKAEDAEMQRDVSLAIEQYQKATSVYPELANLDQIGPRIEKLRGKTDLLNRARGAFENQRWDEAHKAYTEVLDNEAGNQEAAERLTKIESQLLFAQALRYLKSNKFAHAVRTLNAAVKSDPDNREASELLRKNQSYRAYVLKGNAAYREQRCADAETLFRKARATYAERFEAEGLAGRLNQGCEEPIPLPLEDLRNGLLALFSSEPQEAISVFEDVVEQAGEDEVRLHAYLGAAYALAYVIEKEADELLLEQAKEQFRIVLNSNPDFRLSERLFSPRILRVFDEVSRGRPEASVDESDGAAER